MLKHDKVIEYYYGKNRFVEKWTSKKELWSVFAEKLMAHVPTPETMDEWKAMDKTKKEYVKDVGGFVAGTLKDGLRHPSHVLSRTMIVLDADNVTGDIWGAYEMLYDYAAVMYQTHSWRPEKPKVRFVIPLSREVDAELYQAISIHIAHDLGHEQFDPTTHQTNRLMFFPSLPKNAEHQAFIQDAPFLDVDAWIKEHPRWEDRSTWPQVGHIKVVDASKKLGDPGQKEGIIGAFCRVYDVPLAIDKFLTEMYAPGSSEDRYTWIHGSTSNGLQVLDGGWHALSHQATDPTSGIMCNAWDLVRIHLFGEEDKTKMYDLANSDEAVIAELDAERGSAADAFAETGVANPHAMFFRYDVKKKATVFTPKFLADWYVSLQPVAKMAGELYRYMDGKYVPAEEHFLRVTAEALDVEYTVSRVRESLSYLLAMCAEIHDPFGCGYLNVKNGLLDVENMTLVPHTPDYYSTVQIPWEYNPFEECPLIDRFFAEYAGDHAELVWYMAGYCLLETMKFEKSFILLGSGGNGKGTTLELITEMLGAENVSNVSLHKLESNRFAVANVVGKLANIQSDLPSKLLDSEGVVKQLTSGDRIEAERKGRDSFMTKTRAKLLFSTNELPKTVDNSDGFYRKWVVITYDKKFKDSEYRRRMFDEIPGMFAKAVEYAARLMRMGHFPGSGEIEKYRIYSDNVYAFVQECCIADEEATVSKAEFFEAYKQYCHDDGSYPVSKKRFTEKIRAHLTLSEPRTKAERFWKGVKVVTEGDIF